MAVSQSRKIAFDILLRVETQGAFASDLLYSALSSGRKSPREAQTRIKPEDAALATELTLGVLRWQRLLDFLLQPYSKTDVARLDTEVLIALRLGLYQLRFLDKIPGRAAVNESVELVKSARKKSAAGLVNAVLRRAAPAARIAAADVADPHLPGAERLGIVYSHPTWVVERWMRVFGEAETIALLESNNHAANLACTIHAPERREEILAEFHTRSLNVSPGELLRSAIIVKGGSPVDTEAFRRGWISIQDEASQLIPQLLAVRPGNTVLDLCAAPGGKTALLAQAAGKDGMVIAADWHTHRLQALRSHLERCNLADRVRTIALDAQVALPFHRKFDRILVDAPCSGTGTLSRHPEIRWRLRPDEITAFHNRQVAILRSALDALAPGGRLVYSTCSLEPEENEHVVKEALAAASKSVAFRILQCATEVSAIPQNLAPHIEAPTLLTSDGFLRTFPPRHHTDGFFAAIVKKNN